LPAVTGYRKDKKHSNTTIMMKVSTLAFLGLLLRTVTSDKEDIAYCDGCWCIPEPGDSCPVDEMPLIDFPATLLDTLRTIPLTNPVTLDCNPYEDENCNTVPPLEKGGVCAVETNIEEGVDAQCPSVGYSYT
jgi:hypothetical protein